MVYKFESAQPEPTSDNVNPQGTKTLDAPDMGPDRARLSCPGSSVVAVTYMAQALAETYRVSLALRCNSAKITLSGAYRGYHHHQPSSTSV